MRFLFLTSSILLSCLSSLSALPAHEPFLHRDGRHQDRGSYGTIMPTEKAIEMFRGRIRGERDYQNRSILGRLLLRQARETGQLALYSDAEAILREAHQICPDDAAIRIYLSDALAARHEFYEAIELVRWVHERDANDTSAIAALGDAAINIGDLETAERHYARLMELSQAPAVMARLAHCDELRGNIDTAINRLENAVKKSVPYDLPVSERAWFAWRLGSIHSSQGQWTSAKTHFEKALEIVPDHVGATMGLAKTLAATGESGDAIRRLVEIVDHTADPPATALLADLFLLDGDVENAKRYLIKADRAMAEEAKVAAAAHYREYANFLSDHDMRPDQALKMAKKDFERRPDVYSHDALAWALYRNHQYQPADEMIDRALARGTRDATFHLHASLIKAALGDEAAADLHRKISREINPMVIDWANHRVASVGPQ